MQTVGELNWDGREFIEFSLIGLRVARITLDQQSWRDESGVYLAR